MGAIASQITSLTIVYSTGYSDADQWKHQSSAPLAFVWGISPLTGEFPAQMASNAEMFPFDDVIMKMVQYNDSFISTVDTGGLVLSVATLMKTHACVFSCWGFNGVIIQSFQFACSVRYECSVITCSQRYVCLIQIRRHLFGTVGLVANAIIFLFRCLPMCLRSTAANWGQNSV